MEIKHIQSFFKSAGSEGCYAFCLIELAAKNGKVINIVDALLEGIARRYIKFNWNNYDDKSNFFVSRPDAFFSMLMEEEYHVKFALSNYIPKDGEFEVQFWALNQHLAEEGKGHFVLSEAEDTLQSSNTVKNGRCYSKRIFYKR